MIANWEYKRARTRAWLRDFWESFSAAWKNLMCAETIGGTLGYISFFLLVAAGMFAVIWLVVEVN